MGGKTRSAKFLSQRRQTSTAVSVDADDVSRIHIHSGGKIGDDGYGKPDCLEHYYKEEFGGLANAVLIDDDADNVAAWFERGGQYVVDLSQAPGDQKFTIA